jgi:hypothetical protein
VDDQTPNAHHGGPAVVDLNRAFLGLPLVTLTRPFEIGLTGRAGVVAGELPALERRCANLHAKDEHHDLHETGGWDGIQTRQTGRHIGKGDVTAEHTGETHTGEGDEITNDGEHGNTAVLELTESQAVKLFLRRVRRQLERVEKAEWRLGTNLLGVVGVQCHTVAAVAAEDRLLRSKGRGAGQEGGDDGELHGAAVVGRWVRTGAGNNAGEVLVSSQRRTILLNKGDMIPGPLMRRRGS